MDSDEKLTDWCKSKKLYYICFSYNYAKIKFDSHDSWNREKTLNLHIVILLNKSTLIKDQNHYCYNMFIEKCFNQLDKRIMIKIWLGKSSKRKLLRCKRTNKDLGC